MLKMKPTITMQVQEDDASFQEENNDNPSTLCEINIDEETYVRDELVGDMQEEEEVYVGDENEEDEDEDVDINFDEEMLEELLGDEEEI